MKRLALFSLNLYLLASSTELFAQHVHKMESSHGISMLAGGVNGADNPVCESFVHREPEPYQRLLFNVQHQRCKRQHRRVRDYRPDLELTMTKPVLIRAQITMIFLGAFVGLCGGTPSPSGCDHLSSASSDQLLTFLNAHGPEDRDEPYCTEFALLKLGESGNPGYLSVLLKYLTFQREPDDLEKAMVIHRMGSSYPAVNAIGEYGTGSGEPPSQVVDALRSYLSQPFLTDLQKSNAEEVLAYFFREEQPMGVAFLLSESKKLEGASADALRAAAEALASRCGPKAKQSCIEQLANP